MSIGGLAAPYGLEDGIAERAWRTEVDSRAQTAAAEDLDAAFWREKVVSRLAKIRLRPLSWPQRPSRATAAVQTVRRPSKRAKSA